jgi:nucleoside phosphorylase
MSDPASYTVAWICALPVEYVVAQEFLDEMHEKPSVVSPNDTNDYTLGKIGGHNVVIAVLPNGEYGTASAASVATSMLNTFHNIRIGLMVGIGGGVPSERHDVRLGDIVVSASRNGEGGVLQYDFGKSIQYQIFQHTRFLNQPPTALRTAITMIQAQQEMKGHQIDEITNEIVNKNAKLRRKYERPPPSTDRLFKAEATHDSKGYASSFTDDPSKFMQRRGRTNHEDSPAIHYGLIASGNQLMKDALNRDRLAAEKDVLCFEMEAGGLMNTFPYLLVRGICDYSDSHKSKEWQGHAAMNASAYSKDLLLRITPQQVEKEDRISGNSGPPIEYAAKYTDRIDNKCLMAEEAQDYLAQIKARHLPRIKALPEHSESVGPTYEQTLPRYNGWNEHVSKRLLNIIVEAKQPLALPKRDALQEIQLDAMPYSDTQPGNVAERNPWMLHSSIMTTWNISYRHLLLQQPPRKLVHLLILFRAWESLKSMRGTDIRYTLRGMGNPTPKYQIRGRQKAAMTHGLLKKVLSTERSRSLINMMFILVPKYLDQGRLEDAEKIQVQVLTICKEAFGEEHPSTLKSMSLLVSIYQSQGRWDDVEVFGVQLLGTLMRLVGVKHLYTLRSMSDLALAFQSRGQLKDAEALSVQVLESLIGYLGTDHPYTIRSMGNLASIYQNQGRLEDAGALLVLQNRVKNSDMLLRKQGVLLDTTWSSSCCLEASSIPVSEPSLGLGYRSYWKVVSTADISCKLKELLQFFGFCEKSIPPHHQRFRWTNVSV